MVRLEILDFLCIIASFVGQTVLLKMVGNMGGDKNLSMLTERLKYTKITVTTPSKREMSNASNPSRGFGTGRKNRLPSQQVADKEKASREKDVQVDSDVDMDASHSPPESVLQKEDAIGSIETQIDINKIPEWVRNDPPLLAHWLDLVRNEPLYNPHTYLPEECQNDTMLRQGWHEQGGIELHQEMLNNILVLECLARSEQLIREKINQGVEKELRFIEDIDQEVEACHERLPVETKKRLKIGKYANNASLNYEEGDDSLSLGINAVKNALSQLIQANLNDVLLALKEINAYLSSEMAVNWLGSRASLLFCGINYQLKRIASSDIMINDEENEENDLHFEIFELLIGIMSQIFINEIIIIHTSIFDMKDTYSHIFKILSKANVSNRYRPLQDAAHKLFSSTIVKNERTILYTIATIVNLFKEYCLDAIDISDDSMSRSLKRLLFRLNTVSKRAQEKDQTLIGYTKHALNACLTNLDEFYTAIPDPKSNEKCHLDDQFKVVGTMYYTLVEGNPEFWIEALANKRLKQAGAIKQITKFIKGYSKKRNSTTPKTPTTNGWMMMDKEPNLMFQETSFNSTPRNDEDEGHVSPSRTQSKEDQLIDDLAEILKSLTQREKTQESLKKLYKFKCLNNDKIDINKNIEYHFGTNSPIKSFIDYNLERMKQGTSSKSSKLANQFLDSHVTSRQFKDAFGFDLLSTGCPKENMIKFGIDKNLNWSEYATLPFDLNSIEKFPTVDVQPDGYLSENDIERVYDHMKKVGQRLENCYKSMEGAQTFQRSILGENQDFNRYMEQNCGLRVSKRSSISPNCSSSQNTLSARSPAHTNGIQDLGDLEANFGNMHLAASISEPHSLANRLGNNVDDNGQRISLDKLENIRNRFKNMKVSGSANSGLTNMSETENQYQMGDSNPTKDAEWYRQRLEMMRTRRAK